MAGKSPAPKRLNRNRKRMIVLQGGLVLFLCTVGARIGYVQSVFGPRLLTAAKEVQTVSQVSLAPRGSLLDASGHRLAYDVPAFMLDINAAAFPDLHALSQTLAPLLKTSANRMYTLLDTHKSGWVRFPEQVLEPARESINAALLKMTPSEDMNVTFSPTEQRFYPYGEFAANTLGYVNQAGAGESGLELQYNSILSGQNGSYSYTKDGQGFPIASTFHTLTPTRPGDDVKLTIDQTVQSFVESEMDTLVNKYHPQHAAIIVANPKTGAILGMSSRPTYNPNQYSKGSAEALSNNWAVNASFEPGSTFKVMVLAAALATHSISMGGTFMSGHITVANRQIHDWNYVGWGRLTFQQALEYSSNVGFATIAMHLGWPNLLHYMKAFGYLSPTGVGLPNEYTSLIFPPSERGQIQLATSGFGQGIAVTPMQQVAAVGVIANGGKLMKPYIVQSITNAANGHIVQQFAPSVVNSQVVPENIANAVSQTMILDISKGIDTLGYLPGYDVGGKTGTAQIVNPKTGQYYANRFNTSFIGYAPGWDPQIEVYVTLYWPKTAPDHQWGSTIATPAARNILKECLEYYHIMPRSTGAATKSATAQVTKPVQYRESPNLIGLSVKAAEVRLKQLGLSASLIGSALGTVHSQWPQAGVEVTMNSSFYLWAPSLTSHGQFRMPNVVGLSMREVSDMFAVLGLHLQIKGTGFAVYQSILSGHTTQSGSTVTVNFLPRSNIADSPLSSTNSTVGNATSAGNSNTVG